LLPAFAPNATTRPSSVATKEGFFNGLLAKLNQNTVFEQKFMTKKPATSKPLPDQPPGDETQQQHFDRILSRDEFKPLKAILDELRRDEAVLQGAIVTTNSYSNFLGKLGYRVVLMPQIHEQDCYSRLGPAGGIHAVLPHHDMATYSTLVTLVNFDSTVTTTSKSVDFYDNQLAEFKTLLMK
jgi:hypothetical protein